MAKILIIGATGYVGGPVARAFMARGHDVRGLARSEASETALKQAGVPALRSADGDAVRAVADHAKSFDWLVIAAKIRFDIEAAMMRAILPLFRGEGRTLIFTAGTGVVSIAARDGAWDENAFAEDDPFPFPALGVRKGRLPTEEMVRAAAGPDLRTMVLRLPLVWGYGGSDHLPFFLKSARDHGKVYYVGAGLNVISNVHVDDAAELFILAAERGVSGALYHAVAGEVNFRTIAEAIAQITGKPAESASYEDMCERFGREWVNLGLAVNSRTKAVRARTELGWRPQWLDLVDEIRHGSYRAG